MKKYLLLSLITLVSTFHLSAQNPPPKEASGTVPKLNVLVKGLILDSLTNESLPYATLRIALQDKPDDAVKLLAANEYGKFEVRMDRAGEYLLTIHYTGKAQTVKPFNIKDTDKQVDLGKIHVNDNQQLEEVVVTAIKPLVKVDLDKITYSTEDDPDSKTNNVLEMMRKVPMVTVDAEEKIQLKGSSGFKIYLDGKPSNMITNNPSQVLKSMPANTVKSIEVITDPGAKYDAEGVSGIINIITNKQPMGGYNASVNAGANTLGGFDAGAYLTLKYGKLGVTGNFNYYYHNSPEEERSTFTEFYNKGDNQKYLFQNGSSDNKFNGQYGYGELSYEIDTLNLLSASINRYQGSGSSESDLFVQMQDKMKNPYYEYNQDGTNKFTYGGTNINFDYQRTFRKKDELLTSSYRFDMSPNDSESESTINPILNYNRLKQKTASDAGSKEHTFQIDYTTPIKDIHTLEAGAKYIIRLNESSSYNDSLNYNTNQWISVPYQADEFRHRQDILSAYLGYNVKYKKIGFKAGLRMEETKLDANFPLNHEQDFGSDYFNLIPSATFTYQVKEMQNLRLGYNMRIQRPGIWYLNPYMNTTDPRFVMQGNPDLDVEKYHNLNSNYGIFKQKFNINFNLNYSFTDNSIERVSSTRINSTTGDNYTYTTYENIGKENLTGLYVYANVNLTPKLRIDANLSGAYTDIKANDGSGKANHGFQGSMYGGVQYTLPLDFRVSLNGYVGSPWIMLEGKSSSFTNFRFGVNKDFLQKKLTLSLNANNIFSEYKEYRSERHTVDSYSESINRYQSRSINFSVSYRFGEMKQQIKKVSRGINNDDSKGGEGGSGSSGGGGGGQ